MQELLQSLADRAAAAPPLLTVALVFLGGVVSSASPCVLAAVPLIVAAVGGASTSRPRAFALSGMFALGLAVCFTALGAIAALTGRLLGDIGVGWQILLGVVLVIVGLHLTGLVHLPLPQLDGSRFRNAGLAGAFALGALTGTLSSPCATPILVVVLSLVAFEQKVLWGTTLLAAYSLGHVVLLFASGAASGFAAAYLGSRAARWATWTHRAFGVVLLGVGTWVLVAPITSVLKP
ncbi:MAG TPA: cytochrome c biogenesis CcdA family protein [Thermoanaerobaculaceae bacterium]|nr:cytochrome c biogenesis CcdA family protein [Thermoanaerobaculaceae bacterium]HPS79568.1 cytochrome c biogenesis CcdA family protein [Thermoanaerobaculaceae bacterium]